MLKILGGLMLAAPFIAAFIIMVKYDSWKAAITIFGSVIALAIWIGFASWLLTI